jgi:hypothetical protein
MNDIEAAQIAHGLIQSHVRPDQKWQTLFSRAIAWGWAARAFSNLYDDALRAP